MKMHLKLSDLLRQVGFVFSRYTLVILMALVAAVVSITLVTDGIFPDDSARFVPLKLIYLSGLGISLMFAIKMIAQRFGRQNLLELLGMLFLVGLYFVLPGEERQEEQFFMYLIVILPLLSHLLVAFAPFVQNRDERAFWEYNKSLLLNILTSVLFVGVLCGGICLALVAVSQLFDVEVHPDTYVKIFIFSAIFGTTLNFLLLCRNGLPYLETPTEYPVVLKFFTQFILIPLLLLYLSILYAYSAKILVAWDLPRGWVSFMVMAYTVVGILAILLVHPLKNQNSKSWVRIFSRIFFYSIIPLLVLLFVAIYTRILAYGVTEPRYFVVLLAVWLTTLVLYFIAYRRQHIKFIPISLFAFMLFGMFCPYFNAFSTSIRSQERELENLLTENHLLSQGKIDFSREIKSETKEELQEKIDFLTERHHSANVLKYLNTQEISYSEKDDLGDITDNFKKLKYSKENAELETVVNQMVRLSASGAIAISNYSYFLEGREEEEYRIGEDKIEFDSYKHTVTLNGTTTADLRPGILKLRENINAQQPKDAELPQEKLTVPFTLGKYEMEYIVREVTFNIDPQNKSNEGLVSVSGYFLVR